MKAVIQRVNEASVAIEAKGYHTEIGRGLVILLGVEKGDARAEADWLAQKIAGLRIFEDDAGKMSRSILDVGGDALVVSQFTLAGRCDKGRRPSFDSAAAPDVARPLYEHFCEKLRGIGVENVATGIFAAHMHVALVNDGPVTFILERRSGEEVDS